MRTLVFTLALLTFAACSDAPDSDVEPGHAEHTTEAPSLTPVQPTMEDGVQTVAIEAGRDGFQPGAVSLAAGIPARLVFTRTVEGECSSQVSVPDFGIAPVDLPLDEPVAVEFTPSQDGDFSFVCGMEMQRGSILVQS